MVWRMRGMLHRLVSKAPVALHFLSIVVGWSLVTQGIAALTTRPDVVWPIAGGLFLLSVAGWGHLRVVSSAGIYALSRVRKAG